MSRRQRQKSTTGYYHIMLRGNERKNIFCDEHDKIRFVETIYRIKQGNNFYIYAFCLMDNHVHLMLAEGIEDLAKVMKKITTSYVYYFNNKYNRVGHLFQDRFRSEVVETESYVLALARYIHQNPVRAGIVKKASDYKWSSYNDYIDEDNQFSNILDKDPILLLFSENNETARKKFSEFMNMDGNDCFIDMPEIQVQMDEYTANKLYKKLLFERGISNDSKVKLQIIDDTIREFKEKSNLSIRKIAEITNMNKDRINKILKTQ
ncbi:MAG: transposase [Clostridiaceae bacterium]